MMRNLAPVVIGLAAAGWASFAQTPPDTAKPAASNDPPPEAGLDIMQRICAPCHSIDFVTAVGRDRGEWSDKVNDMVNRGAPATPEEIEEMIAYLATNFPAKKD
jgi:mono/diheme cytochrome c family protein